MNCTPQSMDEFYISLPEDDANQSVAALIRHALKNIDSRPQPEKNIDIEHFYLIAGYTNGERPSVYIKYAPVTNDDISRREEYLKFRDKYKVSNEKRLLVFAQDHRQGLAINRFEQRLPADGEQSNAIKLLRAVADTLDRLAIVNVKDLVLHDYGDKDGLEYPYVVVYYASL